MTITCYLDAQDYSVLTDPKRPEPGLQRIREDLLGLARSGEVKYVFSATSVSECAPLTPDSSRLAELRADLLGELCGSNALVSFDRLVRAEVRALAERTSAPTTMLDPDGRWFPEISVDPSPSNRRTGISEIADAETRAAGLNRQQRRAVKPSLMKKGGEPTTAFKSYLDQQDPSALASEFVKLYPMRPECADVMSRWALGSASEKEFNEALVSSLSDVRLMMRWFTTQHAMSSPIADMVRKPAADLARQMQKLVDLAKTWTVELNAAGLDSSSTHRDETIAKQWQSSVDRQLVNLAQRVADDAGVTLGSFTAQDVDKYCLGLSAGVRSLYSSAQHSAESGQKKPLTHSEPADAMHAFYAPYVNVFRTDKRMASHIQRQVERHGTVVVPVLRELPGVLEKKSRENAGSDSTSAAG